MNIIQHEIALGALKDLFQKIDQTVFIKKNELLSGSTIGAHYRHLIEFYQCCLKQKNSTTINYDLRKRNLKLETDLEYAIYTLDSIMHMLKSDKNLNDFELKLQSGKEKNTADLESQKSSFFRELTYCLDHCIHHQSLIRIGLKEQQLEHLVEESFGVAFSTLKHRKNVYSNLHSS